MERSLHLNASGSSSRPQQAHRVVQVCNICRMPPTLPVVTSCGHLFCWPCSYEWLQQAQSKMCPYCRFELREDISLTPIYGNQETENSSAEGDTIPPRPTPPLASSLEDLNSLSGSSQFVSRIVAQAKLTALEKEIDQLRNQLGLSLNRVSDLERQLEALQSSETYMRRCVRNPTDIYNDLDSFDYSSSTEDVEVVRQQSGASKR